MQHLVLADTDGQRLDWDRLSHPSYEGFSKGERFDIPPVASWEIHENNGYFFLYPQYKRKDGSVFTDRIFGPVFLLVKEN